MVEAPGTAPGSTTIIPRIVYRHSRRTGKTNIGNPAGIWKREIMSLTPDQNSEIETARAQSHATRRPTVPALEEMLFSAIPVLDHGFIRVVDYMGDDSAVVQAARVSYGRGTRKTSEDEGLIRYLMRHYHSTPFEMCEIKYHVKLPIFVARQWIRHRTANVNEYSARYSIMDKDYYLPAQEHLAAQSIDNRQGRGEVLDEGTAKQVLALLRQDAEQTYGHYELMLEEDIGLARELARMNLTLNTYTQWYWKTDLHNLFHFLRLRADSHAQYEIRAYAEAMLETVKAWVPLSYGAFCDYRLGAVTFSAKMLEVVRKMMAGEAVDQGSSGLSKREWTEMQAALGRDGLGVK
jgi:thymidylate synthase (FAD)